MNFGVVQCSRLTTVSTALILPEMDTLMSDETRQAIENAIAEIVKRSGFGRIIITIENGRPKWIEPIPSIPIGELPARWRADKR